MFSYETTLYLKMFELVVKRGFVFLIMDDPIVPTLLACLPLEP